MKNLGLIMLIALTALLYVPKDTLRGALVRRLMTSKCHEVCDIWSHFSVSTLDGLAMTLSGLATLADHEFGLKKPLLLQIRQ
jgi:hypothetical protein